MIPERRPRSGAAALKALLAGTIASGMTGCVVGMLPFAWEGRALPLRLPDRGSPAGAADGLAHGRGGRHRFGNLFVLVPREISSMRSLRSTNS